MTQQNDLAKTANVQGKAPEPSRDATGFTPADAFGLLRSYSRHRDFVRLALTVVGQALERRGIAHDASKMLDDEFAGFARINAAARINKFGSPEYSESMKREAGTISKHFSRNQHHPEYFTAEADWDSGWRVPAEKMSFLDVIEMVCDWWGARKGYDDPRAWPDSVKLNLAAKGKYLSPEQLWLAKQVADFLGREAPEGVR